jgi:hypothetical protein
MTATYPWLEAYKAALLETDWSNMNERIQAAEAKIQMRKNELSLDHGGSPEETRAIADAMHSLNVLKGEVASWSDRKSKDAN